MSHSVRLKSSASQFALMAGLAVTISSYGMAAVAQEPAPAEEPILTGPISVEGEGENDPNTMTQRAPLSRIPTTIQDTPQTISVTTRERMDQQNLINLRDVMLRTPGITMHAGEGGGSQPPGDSFNLRGFTTQNDVFVDGVRDIGISNRDMFNLESVEVFKGSSGSFFGRGSGGGSINMTTKKARLGENFTTINAGIGTDSYYRVTADTNVAINDKVAFRLNVLGMDREYAERDVMEDDRIGIAPTLTFAPDPDTLFTLSYLYQKDDGIGDNGVPWYNGKPVTEFGVDRSNFYGFSDNFEKMETNRVTATAEHHFNENLRITNTTQYAWYEVDRWNMTGPVGGSSLTALYPGGLPADAEVIVVSGSQQTRGQESWSLQNQTVLGADFETGPLKHELTASLDLSREEYDTTRYQLRDSTGAVIGGGYSDSLSLWDPAFRSSGLYRTPQRYDDSKADTVGVSLYDRVEFLPGFFAIGNVRYERYKSKTSFTNADGTQAQPDGSTSQNLFSYQAAFEYKPAENQTYYLAYSTSQLPQYDAGLGYGEIIPGTDNRDPQETENIEVGAKISLLNNKLGLGGAIFQIKRDNEQQIDTATGIVTTNDYRKRVRGFELQADGRLTDAWTVSAGYAYLDSEVLAPNDLRDGGVLAKTPKHSGFFWTNYQVTPELNLGAGANYVGKRYGGDGGDKTNGNHVPDQWQIDASAGYQLTQNVRLQLNAINLTNELTYDRIHPGRQAHPGVGRTFILNTSVSF